MQKIIPHLWYDKEAVEAAEFYSKVFPDSKVIGQSVVRNTPSGDCDVVYFEIMGTEIQSISAGEYFKLNPSISFMVNFDPSKMPDAMEKLNEVWEKLSDGGEVMMPIDKYPFSERYGWIKDKFGVTWQLIYTNPEGEERPLVIPTMLFANAVSGKAEEATDFYISVFKNSKRGAISKYPAGMEPHKEGSVMFTDYMLEGQWFAAMDSGIGHGFDFNEAFSLMVQCEDQAEIDYFWEKFSTSPDDGQCGWIKDKYGVSWQIVPRMIDEVMRSGDLEKIDKLTQAFLPMKKLVIAELEEAIK